MAGSGYLGAFTWNNVMYVRVSIFFSWMLEFDRLCGPILTSAGLNVDHDQVGRGQAVLFFRVFPARSDPQQMAVP